MSLEKKKVVSFSDQTCARYQVNPEVAEPRADPLPPQVPLPFRTYPLRWACTVSLTGQSRRLSPDRRRQVQEERAKSQALLSPQPATHTAAVITEEVLAALYPLLPLDPLGGLRGPRLPMPQRRRRRPLELLTSSITMFVQVKSSAYRWAAAKSKSYQVSHADYYFLIKYVLGGIQLGRPQAEGFENCVQLRTRGVGAFLL